MCFSNLPFAPRSFPTPTLPGLTSQVTRLSEEAEHRKHEPALLEQGLCRVTEVVVLSLGSFALQYVSLEEFPHLLERTPTALRCALPGLGAVLEVER